MGRIPRLLILVAVLGAVAGCGVSPAVRSSIEVVSCRLDQYVAEDPRLDAGRRAERNQMTAQLRTLAGLPVQCPEVGR